VAGALVGWATYQGLQYVMVLQPWLHYWPGGGMPSEERHRPAAVDLRRWVRGDGIQCCAQTVRERDRISVAKKCMKKSVGVASSMWLWSAVT
jgi:hypothetical protein